MLSLSKFCLASDAATDMSASAVLCLCATLASAQHSPAFFWSPSALFSATEGGRESLREATAADVEATVGALLHQAAAPIEGVAPLAKASEGAAAPEVQLVFLAEGLQTDAVRLHGARLPAVKALLDDSASSLSVPFTLPTTNAKAFAGAIARVAGEEAEAYLKAHPDLYTNGASDLLVIELAADAEMEAEKLLATHDALVGRVARAVHAGTRGNYAALLTGGVGGARRLLKSTAAAPAYLHTHPTLLTAQLIMLILFVIFMGGFCCLFNLQTPKKFEEPKAA